MIIAIVLVHLGFTTLVRDDTDEFDIVGWFFVVAGVVQGAIAGVLGTGSLVRNSQRHEQTPCARDEGFYVSSPPGFSVTYDYLPKPVADRPDPVDKP
ncbi:hypothetical protein [Kineococcus vitellinus]|uniref:hypothetical protein n=1 Tax=Kineococcus vitellinus TaxID=2696565 RepID=UPI001412F70D|nr:hypothetical protein [Kineococcus vitellinus]